MSTTQWPNKVVPAQLSFLTIYCPALGTSDETFQDQLVFYYSRAAQEARGAARKDVRSVPAGGDALRAEENEKLRQIGLAQGMVDFAKSFSNGEPVDSIETEKSRIILHELEAGWWILASVNLTQLPSLSASPSKPGSSGSHASEAEPTVEYSSREVSSPTLLIQQLIQAHHIFCLHHGPSLSDLFVRLTKDKFCNALERYWTRFARSWDVLLHGNPATDVFDGVKLASGGELGFGVGEEDWGSGEREVLEDLARRTEGIVDLVASRFGDPSSAEANKVAFSQDDSLPWMGSGSQSKASDGIIFGGIAGMQRRSLRDISLWMRQIYTYGEQAYGVKDNPLRERRKRRRPNHSNRVNEANGKPDDPPRTLRGSRKQQATQATKDGPDNSASTSIPSFDERPPHDSNAVSNDDDTALDESLEPSSQSGRPNIPPPIVSSTAKASQKATSNGNQQDKSAGSEAPYLPTTFGIPDNYMKYLTFGLSTLGKPIQPEIARRPSKASTAVPEVQKQEGTRRKLRAASSTLKEDDNLAVTHVDPMPEGEALRAKIARQKRQENCGHFIIGLTGDLLELDELSDNDQTDISVGDLADETDGSRIVLRTIQVEVVPSITEDGDDGDLNDQSSSRSDAEHAAEALKNFRRVRVLVYVHRPFMYCFLFEDRTSSLQLTKFYKSLHRNLVPIHKPLLSSTDPAKVTQRIAVSQPKSAGDESASELSGDYNPVYSLLYDPRRLTIHTSVPNIPEPGTPAAEGFLFNLRDGSDTQPSWTRIEALNVHSQILNTLASVKSRPAELERTSKTSRGWWIVWMKVPPSPTHATERQEDESAQEESAQEVSSSLHSDAQADDVTVATTKAPETEVKDMNRIAFLVRKASDTPASPKTASSGSRAMSSMLEVMSLGMAGREDDSTGGVSAGWGPAALASGIGIDARKYVEGLLSLNR